MRLTLKKILKQIIFDKPECRTDTMKLYYEYLRYVGVAILQIPKLFYDNEFRKQCRVASFSTIERELRKLKHEGGV